MVSLEVYIWSLSVPLDRQGSVSSSNRDRERDLFLSRFGSSIAKALFFSYSLPFIYTNLNHAEHLVTPCRKHIQQAGTIQGEMRGTGMPCAGSYPKPVAS